MLQSERSLVVRFLLWLIECYVAIRFDHWIADVVFMERSQ
jgi:hypothetical protein